MPYALILHGHTQSGALSPEDVQGQKTLALFLQELIEKQDPVVAARLHAPKNSKPFTTALLTPLRSHGLGPRTENRPAPRQSGYSGRGEVKMRLTLLDDTLYPLIAQFFLQHIGGLPTLHLGRSALVISQVSVTSESGEPWAGVASFETLLAQSSETETAWRLSFATPTAFKSGDADLPLPIPRLCFQSWLNSWDEHAPRPFFSDKSERKGFLDEVVEGQVAVDFSQLRSTTQGFYFDGRRTREQGFTGICRFMVKPARTAPPHRHLLGTLARYGFYAGTGRKTTMGMGVTDFMGSERR